MARFALNFPSPAGSFFFTIRRMDSTLTASRTAPVSPSPLIIACLAATWLVWGSTYFAIKYALISFPPFFQMGSRFVVAGLVLLAWMTLRGAPACRALRSLW